MTATVDRLPDVRDVRRDVADLLDGVGHLVADAFDAGGTTWQLTAPLLDGLFGDGLLGDGLRGDGFRGDGPCREPAVVVVRALGHVLRRQAAAVERSLSSGDPALAARTASELRVLHGRLTGLLGGARS